MGGAYVLAVDYPDDQVGHKWQIVIKERIEPDRILFVQKFDLKLLYTNKKALNAARRNRHLNDRQTICEACEGKGEHRSDADTFRSLSVPGGARWDNREPPNVCTVCGGYGYVGVGA